MARIYDGLVSVGYHIFELQSTESNDGPMPDRCFAGQANGLCGTEMPGVIMLTTGLHHGEVGFTIDILDGPPPLDDTWEEIVEASYWNESGDLVLADFYGYIRHQFSLEPDKEYRLRFCGRGFEKGAELDTNVGPEPVDFYSLAFWPAPLAPDTIVKQTSAGAAYWHEAAQSHKVPES